MIISCPLCKKEFTTYPSRCANGTGRFCSRKCKITATILKNSMPLSHKRVVELLDYNPNTGHFFWKFSPPHRSGRIQIGDRAGHDHTRGYRRTTIDGKNYAEHRLVWFWVNGRWPKEQIDHINRVRNDNRITNLREARHGQNRANSKNNVRHKPSNFGLPKGVIRRKDRFLSQITINKKTIFLGSFSSPEEAGEAYRASAKKYHGEYFQILV